MATISKPYTFSAGATIVASEHNSNFDTIYNEFNGSISNANIDTMAAIADSKLAQITTAGKVSGAAITLLTSLPSGAGIIPIANLASGTADGTKFVRDDGTLQTPVAIATKAEVEAASSNTVSVSPGRIQNHPGVAKAWCLFDGTQSGTITADSSYNVTSIAKTTTGEYTITFTTAFADTNYLVTGSTQYSASTTAGLVILNKATTTPQTTSVCKIVTMVTASSTAGDFTKVSVLFYGDQ
jgi:hypothetical protein